jgi:hypothetical protein
MTDTVDERVTRAREYLRVAQQRDVLHQLPSELMREAAESRRQLAALLAVLGEQAAGGRPVSGHKFARPGQVAPDRPAPDACMECDRAEAGHRPAVTDEARQLAQVRQLLAEFDWEFADRQYALEAVERIVTGGER